MKSRIQVDVNPTGSLILKEMITGHTSPEGIQTFLNTRVLAGAGPVQPFTVFCPFSALRRLILLMPLLRYIGTNDASFKTVRVDVKDLKLSEWLMKILTGTHKYFRKLLKDDFI